MVFLVGPPGSGKGSLVNLGFRKLPIVFGHLEMGEEMRQEKEKKTKLGLELIDYQERCILAPDSIAYQLAESKLSSFDSEIELCVSDGWPRNTKQVPMAIQLARKHGFSRFLVIHIQTPEEVCLERLLRSNRGRTDDGSVEKARTRIDIYRQQTKPLFSYLRHHVSDFKYGFVMLSGIHMEEEAIHYANGIVAILPKLIVKQS